MATETAARTYDLWNSVGVNIHIDYTVWTDPVTGQNLTDPYGVTSPDILQSALTYLGVKNVRDQTPGTESRYEAIGGLNGGIKFCIYNVDISSTGTSVQSVVALANKGMLRYIEGLNEYDNFFYPGNPYGNPVYTYLSYAGGAPSSVYKQRDLYAAAKANSATKNIPVLNVSFGTSGPGYQGFAQEAASAGIPNSALFDKVNLHLYSTGDGANPGSYLSGSSGYVINGVNQEAFTLIPNWGTSASFLNAPGIAQVTTESGYWTVPDQPTTAVTYNGSVAIDVQAQACYTVDAIFVAFRGTPEGYPAEPAQEAFYIYECFDQGPNSNLNEQEENWGLFYYSTTAANPKPAATGVRNIGLLFQDSGTTAATFAPGSLAYTLSGTSLPNTILHSLFQRSDGTFIIAIWNDLNVYGPNMTTNSSYGTTVSVTVNLPSSYSTIDMAVYDPLVSATTAQQTFTGTSTPTVTVPDHVVFLFLGPLSSGASTIGGNASAFLTDGFDGAGTFG